MANDTWIINLSRFQTIKAERFVEMTFDYVKLNCISYFKGHKGQIYEMEV